MGLYGRQSIEGKDQFTRRANYFKTYRDNPYQIIRLDLTILRANYEIIRVGDLIKIIDASDNAANIDIRLNMIHNAQTPIAMQRYRKIETYYEKLFVTNAAQDPGTWIEILFAVKEWFDITDFYAEPAAEV